MLREASFTKHMQRVNKLMKPEEATRSLSTVWVMLPLKGTMQLQYLFPVYHLSSDINFNTCIIQASQHSWAPEYLNLRGFCHCNVIWPFHNSFLKRISFQICFQIWFFKLLKISVNEWRLLSLRYWRDVFIRFKRKQFYIFINKYTFSYQQLQNFSIVQKNVKPTNLFHCPCR